MGMVGFMLLSISCVMSEGECVVSVMVIELFIDELSRCIGLCGCRCVSSCCSCLR